MNTPLRILMIDDEVTLIDPDIGGRVTLLKQIVNTSGLILDGLISKKLRVITKGDGARYRSEFSTEADLISLGALVQQILADYPKDGISALLLRFLQTQKTAWYQQNGLRGLLEYGFEEVDGIKRLQLPFTDGGGVTQKNSETTFTWVFNPCNGTIAHERGIKDYAVTGAIIRESGDLPEKVMAGAIRSAIDPLVVYWARKDEGAYVSSGGYSTPIHVSDRSELRNVMVAFSSRVLGRFTTIMDTVQEKEGSVKELLEKIFTDLIGLSMGVKAVDVASGKLDAMFLAERPIYDLAPLMVLIDEAKGKVTDWKGGEVGLSYNHPSRVLATNGALHEPLLKYSRSLRSPGEMVE